MVKETLREYWKILKNYPVLFTIAVSATTIFWIVLDVITPFVLSKIIDLIANIETKQLAIADFMPLFWIFVAVEAAYFIFGRISMRAVIFLEFKVMRDLDNLCFKTFEAHSYKFFSNSFTGSLVTRVNRFTSAFERIFDTFMFDGLSLVAQLVFGIAVIFSQSVFLGGIFLLWTSVFITSVILLTRYKIKFSRVAAAADSRVTGRLADAITNILNIKIFSRSKEELESFKEVSHDRYLKRLKSGLVGEYIRIYKVAVLIVVEIAILWASIKLAISGEISIGIVVLI